MAALTMDELRNIDFAFPYSVEEKNRIMTHTGMTLRDYFAAKAMQALLHAYSSDEIDGSSLEIPDIAYAMADHMMKARSK